MNDVPRVSYWGGRPVTDLTKEELIEALEAMGRMYERAMKDKAKEREFIFDCFVTPRSGFQL